MKWVEEIFGTKKAVIGMVHLLPLPGTPNYDEVGGVSKIIRAAEHDLKALVEGGIDGVMFGNEADLPYELKVGPASVATMAYVIGRLANGLSVPFGVDVLWDPEASIALAAATGARWVREVFTGVYASDMGMWNPNVAAALRYRRLVGAQDVKLFYNVCAEFASPLGTRDIVEVAKSAVFSSLADAICVSGPITGQPVDVDQLKRVKSALPETPVVANTGVRLENIHNILPWSDILVVGTYFKQDGYTWNPVDKERVKALMRAVEAYRHSEGVSR